MLSTHRWALTAAIVLSCFGARSQAEEISYAMTFCENLDVLMDPTNETLRANVSQQTQHTLMMQRTNPYFELRNTSEMAVVTQFSMSIGDLTKNFDWAKAVETSAGVSYTIETVDGVMGGVKSDLLTISFSGFAPGDFVRFRFGISADDPNASMIQDYRTVLFDLNGGDDITGNALVTVDFERDAVAGQLVGQLPNFNMNGLTTATEMTFPVGPDFEHVLPFFFVDSGVMPVPEPTSYLMAAFGILALLFARRRKRMTLCL